ncbi:MAG: RNA polymerase sigma-70 factor [Bacteroidetes bacterium]|nr:MAG: RNA polymerase sigma-70 factor [Bacteroidota bacterium]
MPIKRFDIDSKLISGLKKDDHDSFQQLFEYYSFPLFKFAIGYLKSKELSEDLVQEVFLKIWNNRKDIKPNTSFQSYLFTIALNAVRKYFNKVSQQNDYKHQVLIDLSNNQSDLDKNLDYESLLEKLDEFIAQMPEKRREVFIKKKFEDKSLKEIAEELSVTTKTVEYHITEAMKNLKKEFERYNLHGILFFHLFIESLKNF